MRVFIKRHVRRSPRIERFTGIRVPGWYGPLPGGGYSGATPELDDAVNRAAERLLSHYGRNVQIRFNSDRQSGGAYVKMPSGKEIGINAGLTETGKIRYGAIVISKPKRGEIMGETEHDLPERVATLGEAFEWLTSKVGRGRQKRER